MVKDFIDESDRDYKPFGIVLDKVKLKRIL